MAKIPLRAYTKEIDALIDRGQYEQALAHCRCILKILPKHIDTYRLMAKAYLESQRYSDASDVFQRVLSSIPDDFVSQLGMSIIREDEGNLDAAIWHMERAFEVQPSNGAIQSELRHLYGRRDGFEPPKIRLTCGALARMYYKGELYPQAINELRAALGEDPQRLDLHLMLAKSYKNAGQRVEAVNACSAVLKRLPYCIEANRIQAEILESMGREEDANVYRQNAIALNPYLGQISPRAPAPELVPDEAVVLEKLDWVPDRSVASQPRWASSLGVDLGSQQSSQEDTPDWLQELENHVPEGKTGAAAGDLKVSPFVSEQEQMTGADHLIPDWMKDAGWEQSMGDTTQAEMGYTIDEESSDEESEGLAPAEIPSWLRGIAPEDAFASGQSPGLDEEEIDQKLIDALDSAALPWLEASPPGPSDTITGWLGGVESTHEPESEESSAEGLPDWLVGATAAGIGLAAGAAAGKDREKELEDQIISPAAPEGEDSTGIIAEFDQDFSLDIEGGSGGVVHEWLSDLETADVEDIDPGSAEQAEKAELPEWLVGAAVAHAASELLDADETMMEEDITAGEPLPDQQDLETLAMDESAELPDWLVTPDADFEFEAELAEELPDWLSETQPNEELLEALELSDEEGMVEPPIPAEDSGAFSEATDIETPDIEISEEIPDIPVEAAIGDAPQEQVESVVEGSEMPGWLAGAAAGAALSAAALAGSDDETQEPSETQPEGISSEEPVLMAGPEIPVEQPSAELEEAVTPEEEEAAFAWLEGLAAKQGASEALFLSPDERLEEPPDWVQMEAALAAGALALDGEEEQAPQTEEAEEEEGVFAEEPSEIDALDDDAIATTMMSAVDEADQGLPDWLLDEAAPEGLDELAAELAEGDQPADDISMQSMPEDTSPEEFLPDWLRAAGPESEVAQARAELDEETEIHAWLSQVDQPVEMDSETAQADDFTGSVDEEALDWLPELADEVDLDEVLAEEGEDQILSDWLSRMPSDTADMQTVVEDELVGELEEEQTKGREIPGWMAGAAAATMALKHEGAQDDQAALADEAASPAEAELEDTLPGWLQEPEPSIEETPVGVSAEIHKTGEPQISPEDTQPSTVAGVKEDETTAAGESMLYEAEEPPAAMEEPAGEMAAEVEGALSDDDAAFAWLESLAVKQGATEALLLDPDERLEEPPEWVLEESLQAEDIAYQVEIGDQEMAEQTEFVEEIPLQAESEQDDLPEWLIGAGAAAGAAAAAMLVGDESEAEDEADAELEPEPPEMDLPELEAEIDELIFAEELPDLPDWLADLEPESGDEGEWLPEMADATISKAIADERKITPLDINQASLIEIERLPGVGFRRAQAVIEYRQVHGSFESLDELEAIEGFDAEMLEELAPYMQVARPDKTDTSVTEDIEVDLLVEARAAIYNAEIPTALESYQSLIQKRQSLPEVVKDLEEALYTHPVDVSIWMTLGDAQMRAGQLHKALESYNKAEELLV